MQLEIQLLKEGAVAPQCMSEGAVGYDLYVPEDTLVLPGRNIVPLGFKMAIPLEILGFIKGRSGFDAKGMEVYSFAAGTYNSEQTPEENVKALKEEFAASPCRKDIDVISGAIDPDYRGVPGVIVKSHEPYPVVIPAGTRIAQMIFIPVVKPEIKLVERLSETERGEGGFGHTGSRVEG